MMNQIIVAVVIVMLFVLVIMMIKTDRARPYLAFTFCLVWLFLGAYNAFNLYSYISANSRVYGTPEVHQPYEDFNYYEYNMDSIGWYKDEDDSNYYYQTTYATSMDFDGTENEYTLLLNNRPCETSSAFGKLQGTQSLYFTDVDGTYKSSINLKISFTFYVSTITLRIETDADDENINLLNEYIKVNNFKLRIIDKVYISFPLLTDKVG